MKTLNMKNFLLLLLVFVGVSNIQAQISLRKKSITRAVVVGISDYQHPDIPDLQFANRDAEAFEAYLSSPSGGNVMPENIQLLVNKEATTANFAAALDWLMTESKENDLAIIYFSGHGDVETKTRSQMGYLLTYDSPNSTYVAGAFPVYYLQEVVATLSIDKKAKVILFTDACHAGKLAGNSVSGSQATASNMARQFASEVKILSCQPDEYSNESLRWGGGRGVFSWFLINGLYGMADTDNDLMVSLMELSRYLEDKIPAEVSPEKQIPMSFGNRSEMLSMVDVNNLSELRSKIEHGTNTLGYVKTQKTATEIDSIPANIRRIEQAFAMAISLGNLMPPTQENAYDQWQLLLRKAHDFAITRQCGGILAANLQSKAQQIFNKVILYQSGKDAKIDQILRNEILQSMDYLDKAHSILGAHNLVAKNINAKKIYLEGILVLDDLKSKPFEMSKIDGMIEKSEVALDKAPDAAFLYHTLGELYVKGKGNPQKGLEYFTDAQILCPNWDAIYIGVTYATERLNKPSSPNDMYEEKVGTSAQASTLDFLNQTEEADKLILEGDTENATKIYENLMDLYPKNALATSNYGFLLTQKGKYNEAEEVLLNALKMGTSDPRIFSNLCNFYLNVGSIEQAERFLLQGKSKYPNDANLLYESARVLALKGKNEEATQQLLALFSNGYAFPQRVKSDIAFEALVKKPKFKEDLKEYVRF
jgi:protein O-mannosyl-transferase